MADNSEGSGAIRVGAVVYPAGGSLLRLAGNIATAEGDAMRLILMEYGGTTALLDLKNASGADLEDFELVTGEVRSRGLRLSNGILYALYEGGTVVLLR